jgi:hypothetical protein
MPNTEVRIPDDITDAEWAYLAGLIDAEAWIGVHGSSKTVQLGIRMPHEGVIDWLCGRFAGRKSTSIPADEERKQTWRWTLTRQADLYHVFNHVVGYLRVKRLHAYEAIHFLYLCQEDKLKPNDPQRINALMDLRRLNIPRNTVQGVRSLK